MSASFACPQAPTIPTHVYTLTEWASGEGDERPESPLAEVAGISLVIGAGLGLGLGLGLVGKMSGFPPPLLSISFMRATRSSFSAI